MNYVMGLAGMAYAALLLPIAAIEKPATGDIPGEKTEPGGKGPNQAGQGKPNAWVGLGGSPVSEILSKHLGLKPGHGLTVFHVCEGSAADKAGIKLHDVVTEFDGKRIGSLQDLKDAVTVRKPGEEVLVKFIQDGKPLEKKLTLGSRLNMQQHHRPDEDNDPLWQGMGHLPKMERDRLEQTFQQQMQEMKDLLKRGGGIAREDVQRLMENLPEDERDLMKQKMEKRVEEMEKALNEPGGFMRMMQRQRAEAAELLEELMADDNGQAVNDRMIESLKESIKSLDESMKRIDRVDNLLGRDMRDLREKLEMDIPGAAPGNKSMKFDFNAQASVTRMDNEGSVTIRTINGNKEVIVKDKSGKVLFEGPHQTEQDKAAVPEEFRQRIEGFDPDFPEFRAQLVE